MELLTTVFRQLVSLAVTALPVIGVVLAVRWLLAKLNASKKYSLALWWAVWLRLVCPVKWKVRPWSIFNLRPLERVAEYSEAVAAASPAVSAPAAPAVTAPAAVISPPAPAAAVDWQALAWRGAAVVWLVGLAALLAYGVWSWLRLRRQVSAAVWNGGNVWECDAIPTPFVLGYVQPRIYIPFHLDSDERTYVLAHERYHLRRGDQWWKLLSCLILAVYWWDAAAWLCWVLFCRDLEMRCDEAVLAQLGDQVKRGYSLSLVSFAMERRFPAALALGGARRRPAGETRAGLEEGDAPGGLSGGGRGAGGVDGVYLRRENVQLGAGGGQRNSGVYLRPPGAHPVLGHLRGCV